MYYQNFQPHYEFLLFPLPTRHFLKQKHFGTDIATRAIGEFVDVKFPWIEFETCIKTSANIIIVKARYC